MTDREMLEFAARTGAIELWHEGVFTTGLTRKVGKSGILSWNPLTDDGDALRLAVKLRMSVTVFDNAVGIGIKGDFGYREYDITPDPHAATRWAITHAAAEIGKAMP